MILVGFALTTPALIAHVTKTGQNSQSVNIEVLDKYKSGARIPGIPANPFPPRVFDEGIVSVFMTPKPSSPPENAHGQPCKHPRVQIVSRDEDAEFLECLECREIFESSELKDMSIEEATKDEADEA